MAALLETTTINLGLDKSLEGNTLARLPSWLERCPVHQEVEGSIPSQGLYLSLGFDPQSGHIWEISI